MRDPCRPDPPPAHRVYDTAAPGPGGAGAGAADGTRRGGSGGLARLLELVRAGQPISSSALPFVSLTNFRTNGMESAANTV